MLVGDPVPDLVARAILLTLIGLAWVLVLVRVNGLRSLSKMTSFDFVMTIALGSLLAGAAQATLWPGFAQAAIAMMILSITQFFLAQLRRQSNRASDVLDNDPISLMRDGAFNEIALAQTWVSKNEVVAKLREANVLEGTSDISVLHGENLEKEPLDGVVEKSPSKS